MRRIITRSICTAAALAPVFVPVFAGDELAAYTPERYELIVARSPFGAEESVVAPEAGEGQAEIAASAASKELRLCFLLESRTGEIRAGFQNLKPRPNEPGNVILMQGESFRSMKLVEIDLAESRATFENSGKRVVLELTKPVQVAKRTPPPNANAARAVPQPVQQQDQTEQRRFGGGFRRREPPAETAPAVEQPALTPEEEQARREEVRRNLQEYQMEVIRQGMPPLPIPLTPEQDDQLVAEGVLPPLEEGQ